MKELSPAARAVLDAINTKLDEAPWDLTFIAGSAAAAALRAVADQVPYLPKNCSSYDINVQDGREEVRSFLLAIAAELEAS